MKERAADKIDRRMRSGCQGESDRVVRWTEVNFGKWTGKHKTLPQILVLDSSWFFWAVKVGALKGPLYEEARLLWHRAQNIKLPKKFRENHYLCYIASDNGGFEGFYLSPVGERECSGLRYDILPDRLNLNIPSVICPKYRRAWKIVIGVFRHYWFNDGKFTKRRVESFFGDSKNFHCRQSGNKTG